MVYNSRQFSARNQVVKRNFDFVYFPENPDTHYLNDIDKRQGEYFGIITLEMNAVDNIYLGSGFIDYNVGAGLIGTTVEELNKAIIPGSSVKGAVRHVARAISDGCIMQSEKERLRLTRQQISSCVSMPKNNKPFHVCIVCDMFGTMGLKSKLSFSDFVADKYEVINCQVPVQFSPNVQAPFYLEDRLHKGYKLYYTECENRESDKLETVTALEKGAVFTGKITFDGLDENELILFLHSLGIGEEYFSHKIGGYKADGFGTVNFKCVKFEMNGKEILPSEAETYAKAYVDKCSDDCYDRIKQLRKIMHYKK
ncbi:MAG: hypothetical protein K2J47_02955 [Ruminococcus sp.]|nr:hypothetical protein [Oscillospiraceae bacterium]MDE6788262.1 hypothetical protein [Ruminococcus sp.]